MLIKYYTLNFPADTYILDSVSNVRVINNIFTGLTSGPSADMIDLHLCYDSDAVAQGKNVQFIDFTQDGVRCRLPVYGKAYICTDQGKTIEPVDPVNGFEHQEFTPLAENNSV